MKIIADCDIPYLSGILEPYADIEYIKGAEIGPRDVRDADALIIRTRTRCDAELLEGSGVRFIGTATIGTDHIDRQYCEDKGIAVYSAAGCNARGVLQWVAAALVFINRKYGTAPGKTTIGVVGVGNVGSKVAHYARMWGYRVMCCDPIRRLSEKPSGETFFDLEEVLSCSDIITLHTPLTHDGPFATKYMIDSRALNRMKSGAAIINCARGGVVDEAALIEAIEHSRIMCSAIDTWENEPRINPRLLELSDIATPHIAGYSVQGKAAGTSMTVRALARFFSIPELMHWYPEEIPGSMPEDITWERMSERMDAYFDIKAQSDRLKLHPEKFEEMRNAYEYRVEFF